MASWTWPSSVDTKKDNKSNGSLKRQHSKTVDQEISSNWTWNWGNGNSANSDQSDDDDTSVRVKSNGMTTTKVPITSVSNDCINGITVNWDAFDRLTKESDVSPDTDSSDPPPIPSPVASKLKSKGTRNGSTNGGALQWQNEMVLTLDSVKSVYSKMTSYLSFKTKGFEYLDDGVYRRFIDEHLDTLRTLSGRRLIDIGGIPGMIDMIRQIRSHRMQVRCMDGARTAIKVIASKAFRQHFAGFKLSQKTLSRDMTNKDFTRWIKLCNREEIPPFVLLARWVIKCDLVKSYKDLTTWIRKGPKKKLKHPALRNESFHNFVLQISKADESSFQFMDLLNQKASHFEEIGFQRLEELLEEYGLDDDIEMLTEEQQREQWDGEEKLLTPDVLFSSDVKINGHNVRWVDFKNFFVTERDSFMFKKLKQTIDKYNERFGRGAIMCRGFQSKLKVEKDTLLLDAYSLGL